MEVLEDVLYGEAPPQGPTSHPFIIIPFLTEKVPLLYTVEPLTMATLSTEEKSDCCREVETRVNGPCREVAVSQGLTVISIIDKIIY